jgi:hypothetical protein
MNDTSNWIIYVLMLCAVVVLFMEQIHALAF